MTPEERIKVAEKFAEMASTQSGGRMEISELIAFGQLNATIANVQLQQAWLDELHSGLEEGSNDG